MFMQTPKYTAPVAEFTPMAPVKRELPDTETAAPNWSCAIPFEAMILFSMHEATLKQLYK
jgi:hypothetical protein